jgi:hypothetical protein
MCLRSEYLLFDEGERYVQDRRDQLWRAAIHSKSSLRAASKTLFFLICILFVAACAPTKQPAERFDNRTPSKGIYSRPFEGFNQSAVKKTILWQQSNGVEIGKTMIVYGIEEAQGRVSVCGLFMHVGSVNRRAFARAMANSGVLSGEEKLVTDIRYFREISKQDKLLFACMITGHAWDTRYAQQPARLDFRGEVNDPDVSWMR